MNEKTNGRAKAIRHEAAIKWGVPTKDIDWQACVSEARREARTGKPFSFARTWKLEKPGFTFEIEKIYVGQGGGTYCAWNCDGQNGNGVVKTDKSGKEYINVRDHCEKPRTFAGKKATGIMIDINVIDEILTVQQERKNEERKIVKDIISGKQKIEFSVVGCDDKYYQAWTETPNSTYCAQSLMLRAIKEMTGESYGNACAAIGKIIWTRPRRKNELPEYATQARREKNRYGGYDYIPQIMTNWESELAPIASLLKEQSAADRAHQKEVDEAVKETSGRCWECGCKSNYLDETGYCGC